MQFEICKNYPVVRLEHQGENLARKITFDVSSWVSEHGPGSLTLLHQRPGEYEPYPIPLTIDDGLATWRPLEADMQYEGQGNLQLVYTTETVIAKSPVYKTLITASLGESTDPPEPYIPWIEVVIEARDRAESAAETAEEIAEAIAAASATASIDDAFGVPEVVVTKELVDDHYNLDFAFKNLKGNGIESIVKTGSEEGVDTYTITFSDGSTTTYQVENGKSGVYVGSTPPPPESQANVWIDPDGEATPVLPDIQSGDAGKFLRVNSDETAAEWQTVPEASGEEF